MTWFPERAQYADLPLGAVRPTGWMRQQMLDDLAEGFAGHLDQLTDRARSRIFLDRRVDSFEATPSGTIQDTPRSWWNGETEAVWLDGLTRMAYLVDNPSAKAKADRLMHDLLASQDASGYIGIYTPASRYRHRKENGEFWTQSRAFVAMLAYYELTGDHAFLSAVERAMRLTMAHYGPHRAYFNNAEPAGGTGHGLMLVDALEWLYRLTGDQAYRDYGAWCYRDYCSAGAIRDSDNQLERLLNLEAGFHWHTPHTAEHLRVPLWVAYATGDSVTRRATENAFAKIRRYLVPSGAAIGDELIGDRRPTPDMPYEYCAITELLTSLQSACQKTGDATFADMVEWLAFNAAQGARLPDGRAISYLTRDNRGAATADEGGGRMKLSPTHEDVAVCCNPNATKLLPYYVNRMWLSTADGTGLCAMCYGPSVVQTEVAGVPVAVHEETTYPFGSTVRFRVSSGRPCTFTLKLRVPGWASDCRVDGMGAVAASDAGVERSGAYIQIRRTWRDGDEVVLKLGSRIALMRACNGEAAVRRGPLLYALPIPEMQRVVRRYPVAGFADIEALPSEAPQQLRLGDPCDFDLMLQAAADLLRPWSRPPVRLAGRLYDEAGRPVPVALVPFGCTVLRQTTFSMRDPS